MRADKGALVTLGTAVGLPDRHLQGDAALLPGGGAGGKGAVFHPGEGAHRQQVATLAVHGLQDIADEVRHQGARLRRRRASRVAQWAGTVTRCSAAIPSSIARWFISMTLAPLLP